MTFCKTTLLAVSALVGSAALADEHSCNPSMMEALNDMLTKLELTVSECSEEDRVTFKYATDSDGNIIKNTAYRCDNGTEIDPENELISTEVLIEDVEHRGKYEVKKHDYGSTTKIISSPVGSGVYVLRFDEDGDRIIDNIAVGCAIPDDSSEELDVTKVIELCNGDLMRAIETEFNKHEIEKNCSRWIHAVSSGDSELINCSDGLVVDAEKELESELGNPRKVGYSDSIFVFDYAAYGYTDNYDGAHIFGASGTCKLAE